MLAIKSRILRIWDTAATGVRICCIKFAQQVVLAQTTGPEPEPRVRFVSSISGTIANGSFMQRDGYVDMSLALVPENHPLIPPRNLEAEASGLLDRVLGIFQESAMYVPVQNIPSNSNTYRNTVLINATLNSLSVLVRARPRTANKILNVILNFNPLKLANSPMTPKLRVMVKSMEKTTRSLLIHINKRYGFTYITRG
jgi:symplekin